MRTRVLSFFSLTTEQRRQTGAPASALFSDLATLRLKGVRGAVRDLAGSRFAEVWFVRTPADPIELLAMADLALGIARGRQKFHCQLPDARRTATPRLLLVSAASRFVWAVACGLLAAAGNRAAVGRLRKAAAAVRPRKPAGHVAYLRASFGLPTVGGSVGHTSGVIDGLVRLGRPVHVFAAARPVGISDSAAFTAVPLPASTGYPHEFNCHRQSRRFHRRVLEHLRRRPPRFLYQRYVVNDLSGVRLANALGIPLVLEYNGSEVWAQRHWGRPLLLERTSTAIERACLRQADLVVTVSAPLEREVLDAGVPASRVLFYPNGVDPTLFDPDRFDGTALAAHRAALGVQPSDLLCTFVGTFGRWHGAEVLADAIALLPPAVRGRRLQFLFIGDGLTRPAAEAKADAAIAAGRVTFAGPRPQSETPLTLAASDILVSPHVPNADGSTFFGSPTKLFEYMAMRRIIVASELDQVGQVLRGWTPHRGEATEEPLGILVEPGSVTALAAGLERAAALDPAQRAALGARARAQVLEAFTWDRHVQAILQRLETA